MTPKMYAMLIVCNAERYIPLQQAHISDFFDQIVIVEGPAAPGPGQAGGDGRSLTHNAPHSTDGTLNLCAKWHRDYDHVNVVINTRGPWPGKTAMCNAAVHHLESLRCEPGYVWQIDADEFYYKEKMELLRDVLATLPDYTDVEFWCKNFWGDITHHLELSEQCPWTNKGSPWRRVFKWHPGDRWASHEPARMKHSQPEKLLSRNDTKRLGIFLHHYGYCFRDELTRRERFYSLKKGSLTGPFDHWNKTKPLHCPGGKMVVFNGQHPIPLT